MSGIHHAVVVGGALHRSRVTASAKQRVGVVECRAPLLRPQAVRRASATQALFLPRLRASLG
jgi:hypothetical protein